MKFTLTIIALLLVSGLAIVQLDELNGSSGDAISADVTQLAELEDREQEFKKAYEPVAFEFPKDHGPHPDYLSEWWYYTGNLADAQGNRYGYQFTIFRRGIVPGEVDRESEWGTRQVWFAHFAVTDVAGETFGEHERYSRGQPQLAGAQGEPYYHVWLDDWEVKAIEPGTTRLQAQAGSVGLDLVMEQTKPAALQGNQGLSAKSDEPGNASYYYSLTNLASSGTVTTPRGTFEVSGKSWMDREWSTSILGNDAEGWDWFSLQLDDNREIMFYNIRRDDGSFDPASSGILVNPDGTTQYLKLDDVTVEALDTWTSPESEATYPSKWRLAIPSQDIDLTITPMLNDQELNVSFTYWEGAVRVEGTHSGYGYVELTGYKDSLRGRT